ncbi:MAG: long-chain fatty acid--CoA ligase [Nitrososphaerota archaeon]
MRRTIKYPNIPLPYFLINSAKKYPKKVAIIFNNKKISYSELKNLSIKLANSLRNIGVKKNDRVALFLPNCPQFVISYYGALMIGSIITALNPLFKEKEIEFQLYDSGAETIIVLDNLYPLLKKALEKTKIKRIIITSFNKEIEINERSKKLEIYYFEEFIKESSIEFPKISINPKEDLATIQYTGGTTGIPKGAMLTHFNLVSNAIAFSKWLKLKKAKETFLTALPLYHVYGMTTSMNTAIYSASTMVIISRFNPEEALKLIQEYKVTIFCGVPTMYSLLLSTSKINDYDLSSLKVCISGASPLPPNIQKEFMEKTGVLLIEGYGLSEASPVTHCNPVDKTLKKVKIGSIGLPLYDTEAKIVDIEKGKQEVPIGEIGELIIKGPQIMKGYWNELEETKIVLKNGWFYTGDLAKIDKDGYFYIVDRKKDLIKYKGYSVYPREIEDILYEHPNVKICAVIGKPDPIAGEIPKAYIVLKEDSKTTKEEIMDFVNKRVASYKAIREVEFRKELPLSTVGKILKRVLKEEKSLATS